MTELVRRRRPRRRHRQRPAAAVRPGRPPAGPAPPVLSTAVLRTAPRQDRPRSAPSRVLGADRRSLRPPDRSTPTAWCVGVPLAGAQRAGDAVAALADQPAQRGGLRRRRPARRRRRRSCAARRPAGTGTGRRSSRSRRAGGPTAAGSRRSSARRSPAVSSRCAGCQKPGEQRLVHGVRDVVVVEGALPGLLLRLRRWAAAPGRWRRAGPRSRWRRARPRRRSRRRRRAPIATSPDRNAHRASASTARPRVGPRAVEQPAQHRGVLLGAGGAGEGARPLQLHVAAGSAPPRARLSAWSASSRPAGRRPRRVGVGGQRRLHPGEQRLHDADLGLGVHAGEHQLHPVAGRQLGVAGHVPGRRPAQRPGQRVGDGADPRRAASPATARRAAAWRR